MHFKRCPYPGAKTATIVYIAVNVVVAFVNILGNVNSKLIPFSRAAAVVFTEDLYSIDLYISVVVKAGPGQCYFGIV